jgi:hypothetical protein
MLNPTSGWQGQLLQTALQEPPQLVLQFFSYGILMRKALGDGTYTEYPVDAAHIAQALAAKVRFDTGLLNEDTLLIRREGVRELIVSYRRPQKTGLWLEGSDEPLRVPLPGLIRIRACQAGAPQYQLYAVKRRPKTLTAPLYHAPLPNVFSSGSICWGSVPQALPKGASLTDDWARLLGSPFGSHAVGGKSRQHRDDIRALLLKIAADNKRVYPTGDLMAVEKTLEHVIKGGRSDD